MKKRLKGLLALFMAVCIVLLMVPVGETYAAENKTYNVGGSSISDADDPSSQTISSVKLIAGDKLSAAFTGGFVVLDNRGNVLQTANSAMPGVSIFSHGADGTYQETKSYLCFTTRDDRQTTHFDTFVVPDLPGYNGFQYNEDIRTNLNGVDYYTYNTTNTTTGGETCPVHFMYLTPIPNKYTVQYDANHENTTGTMTDQAFTYGIQQNLTANGYTLTGYHITGWNTSPDGSGTSLADSSDGSIIATDSDNETVRLYAQWAPNTYSVKFHANGGEGKMNNQSFAYDTPQQLTVNGFKAEGKKFIGWNTEADGSGTKYKNKQEVTNLSDKDGAVIHLYAQWKDVAAAGAEDSQASPPTGDGTNLWPLLLLMLSAGLGMLMLHRKTHRS